MHVRLLVGRLDCHRRVVEGSEAGQERFGHDLGRAGQIAGQPLHELEHAVSAVLGRYKLRRRRQTVQFEQGKAGIQVGDSPVAHPDCSSGSGHDLPHPLGRDPFPTILIDKASIRPW